LVDASFGVRMILVTGATGELGSRVVRKLLARAPPQQVAVAVRNPSKAQHFAAQGVEVREADYDRPLSWIPALVGVERLLLISSPEFDVEKRVAQHRNVINAARALGVKLVAYTSFIGADTARPSLFNAHYFTERALEQSGVAHTFLRNPLYTESVVPKAFLEESVRRGVVKSAAGTRSINSATRADLSEAAAVVLTSGGHENKAYELTGPRWTFAQLAAAVARATELPIELREVAPDELGAMAFIYTLMAEGFFEHATTHLADLIGRRPIDIDQYTKNVLGPEKDSLVRESRLRAASSGRASSA
jgi:NAD(P)H dehydrogenase (quinone)